MPHGCDGGRGLNKASSGIASPPPGCLLSSPFPLRRGLALV